MSTPLLNLYQLQLFLAVIEHGSYTRAAEILHLSQPAISSRIRALEESIGEKVFDQIGRQIHLTDAGRELRLHAETILRQVANAQRSIAEIRALERGTLRVVATTTFGTYILPSVLGAFHRTYPGITLVMDVTNEARAVDMVRQDEMDLAVVGFFSGLDDMEIEHVLRNELFVAAAPTHPLAHKETITFEEFAACPLLLREQGAGTRDVIDRLFQERHFQPKVAIELRQNAIIKQGIMAELGIGVLSRLGARAELAQGTLVALTIEGIVMHRDWHVVHRRERKLPRAAAAFKTLLHKHLEDYDTTIH